LRENLDRPPDSDERNQHPAYAARQDDEKRKEKLTDNEGRLASTDSEFHASAVTLSFVRDDSTDDKFFKAKKNLGLVQSSPPLFSQSAQSC
jgi:hypothetical protein